MDPFEIAGEDTAREFFGRTPEVEDSSNRPAPIEPPWACHGCACWFAFDDEPVITLVAPDYVLFFCSDECALDTHHAKAVTLRASLYEIGGPWRIFVTEHEELPRPFENQDIFADVFARRGYDILVEGPALYTLTALS